MKRRWIRRIGCITLAILLIVFGSVTHFLTHYYQLTQYEGRETPVEADSVSEASGLTDSEAEALRAAMPAASETEQAAHVYNLLLVGVDRRDDSWNGNSDAMVLVSINSETKRLHLISFLRDLYAEIPGHGVRKLNAACAYGGVPLLAETLKTNYGVHIDHSIWVDFSSMIDLVDAIGGVELTLSDAEARSANHSILEMCRLRKADPKEHELKSGGTFVCDGYQTVAYARIRKVGNADYERTERQRTVLKQLLERIKAMNVVELNAFANQVLPLFHHDLSAGDMAALLAAAPRMLHYPVETDRVPYDGLYTVKKELLISDLPRTRERLWQTINEE